MRRRASRVGEEQKDDPTISGKKLMSNAEKQFPEWENHLQDLAFEYDREKLSRKLQTVEALIFERLQRLSASDDHQERQYLNRAIESLRTIKRDRLGFPDW